MFLSFNEPLETRERRLGITLVLHQFPHLWKYSEKATNVQIHPHWQLIVV